MQFAFTQSKKVEMDVKMVVFALSVCSQDLTRLLRLAFMSWLALAVCHAASWRVLDLNQLTQESIAVVYGRIEAFRVEWNTEHTRLLTVYTVRAERYLTGC